MKTTILYSVAIIILVLLLVLGMRNKKQGEIIQVDTDINLEAFLLESLPGETIIQTNQNQESMEQQTTIAKISTNKGVFTIELFPELAPTTVEKFITLAQNGFYNGTRFHRVIEGFMIQGGDPLSKDTAQMSRWGTGGPGYTFADEIHSENKNLTGTISMANAGPNTNGSQFFINVADNNFLDTKHTVFGKVLEGYDIVEMISLVDTIPGVDRPVSEIVIESIEIQ